MARSDLICMLGWNLELRMGCGASWGVRFGRLVCLCCWRSLEKKSCVRGDMETDRGMCSGAGVGVKNEQLLVSKGIQSVENLKTLYLAKFREQTADMHEYLQVMNHVLGQTLRNRVDV